MLDEALPTFFLKPSADKIKHHEAFYFTQNGSVPEPTYALTSLDPSSSSAKNTYAVALFDSHNPDILYGEVLSKPGWSQSTLSQEEIRKNGGVPPPPSPIFPTEIAIQLYNPDQQVIVKQQTSKWSNSVSFAFSMPQIAFRTPSVSTLDRSQNDPGADATTPQVNFVWRKEGRYAKDLTCYMTGKSTDPTGKKAKKSKEPDIAVALFTNLKEITIMESNLYRVEVEDYKGLEVVILLSGAVIRDLFFGNANEPYHISSPNVRKNSGGLRGRTSSSPLQPGTVTPAVMTPRPPPPQQTQRPVRAAASPSKAAAVSGLYSQPIRYDPKRASLPLLQTNGSTSQRLDPRAQWEIDAETARLRAQVEAEAREQRRQQDASRRARRKQDEEAERKTRQLLENEDRLRRQAEQERRRKQAEVDKETERLRRKYGQQDTLGPLVSAPQQRYSAPLIQGPFGQPSHGSSSSSSLRPPASHGPYLQPNGPQPTAASQSTFSSNGLPQTNAQQKMKKKSFWGLRSSSENDTKTLRKKQSSMF